MLYVSEVIHACRALADRCGTKWHLGDPPALRLRLPSGRVLCPLTAACLEKTGRSFFLGSYLKAAGCLGIPEDIAEEIATAADSPTDDSPLGDALRKLREEAPPEPPAA